MEIYHLITTSSIFSIWNGMIICWVIWRIMKQRLNVEGLIAVLLLSIIQLLMLALPSFSPTNLMNISFLLNIICLIWICLLIKNVEMRELLNNWKSKDSWKSFDSLFSTICCLYKYFSTIYIDWYG